MATLTLVDKVRIAAPPADVWCFIEDPDMVAVWNPKLLSTERVGSVSQGVGCTYRAVFSMNGRETHMNARIEDSQHPQRLVVTYCGGDLPPDGTVRETWELVPDGETGTRVRHTVDMVNTGIGLLFRIVIRMVHRFGRPVGQDCMERLKQLVEQSHMPDMQTSGPRQCLTGKRS